MGRGAQPRRVQAAPDVPEIVGAAGWPGEDVEADAADKPDDAPTGPPDEADDAGADVASDGSRRAMSTYTLIASLSSSR